MGVETLIALGSLLIATTLAVLQVIKWMRDQRSSRVSELLEEAHSDEARDSLIVGSAERAVVLLERSLINVSNDAEALRNRVRELEGEVASLRAEIAVLLKGN